MSRQANGIGTFVGGMAAGALGLLGINYALHHKNGEYGDLKYEIYDGGDRDYWLRVTGPDNGYADVVIKNLQIEKANPEHAEKYFLEWLRYNQDEFDKVLKDGNRTIVVDMDWWDPYRGVKKVPSTKRLKNKLLRR